LFAGLVLDDEEMKNIGKKSGDYLIPKDTAGKMPS